MTRYVLAVLLLAGCGPDTTMVTPRFPGPVTQSKNLKIQQQRMSAVNASQFAPLDRLFSPMLWTVDPHLVTEFNSPPTGTYWQAARVKNLVTNTTVDTARMWLRGDSAVNHHLGFALYAHDATEGMTRQTLTLIRKSLRLSIEADLNATFYRAFDFSFEPVELDRRLSYVAAVSVFVNTSAATYIVGTSIGNSASDSGAGGMGLMFTSPSGAGFPTEFVESLVLDGDQLTSFTGTNTAIISNTQIPSVMLFCPNSAPQRVFY